MLLLLSNQWWVPIIVKKSSGSSFLKFTHIFLSLIQSLQNKQILELKRNAVNFKHFSVQIQTLKPNLTLVKRCEIQSRRFSIHRRCQFLFSFVSTAMSVWLWDDRKNSVFPTKSKCVSRIPISCTCCKSKMSGYDCLYRLETQ